MMEIDSAEFAEWRAAEELGLLDDQNATRLLAELNSAVGNMALGRGLIKRVGKNKDKSYEASDFMPGIEPPPELTPEQKARLARHTALANNARLGGKIRKA